MHLFNESPRFYHRLNTSVVPRLVSKLDVYCMAENIALELSLVVGEINHV